MLSNRTHIKWLITLPLLLCLGVVCQPRGAAGRSITEFSEQPTYQNGVEARVHPHEIMLADNHRTEEQTGKTDAHDDGAAEKNAATDIKKKVKKEDNKTKPLKSFVPTEKVKADQAVDFPYDI